MVNASGHIEQQLSKLQTQTADIATELETLVDSYLQVLSQASKRQLVLAAYHVCTQIYPEKFLGLSLSQRNRLQQHLRDLGNRIQPQLHEKWETAKRLSLQPAEEDGLAVIRQLFLEAAALRDQPDLANASPQQGPLDPDADNSSSDDGKGQDSAQEDVSSEHSQEKFLAEIHTLIGSEPLDVKPTGDEPADNGPMLPAQLMRRQILIEKAIRDVLKAVSEKANNILQKADVMPELPTALLNAASESERLGHTPMKTPNLVRLSIKILPDPEKDSFEKSDDFTGQDDTDSDQWPDETELSAAIIAREDISAGSSAKKIDGSDSDDQSAPPKGDVTMPRLLQLESLPNFVVIHLRLSEIEFAETNVAIWRNRIRKKMSHLKRVGHAYKDAERQLAIAQAEDAWRASWTND
ncbi:hypothetical protein IQ260_24980 [Leptolyngbya cf. ectocarpi LEGE 11479]|uniref:Uncharacterized protein n=1 Tax=Leptolyngbya cf. ectocarpi LEGE 11479 TaxID=1828722 RepID=A0A928ZYM2_LEPEC|nr:hypothetical protein [Leptolyngbya ectocarpi]MBE9069899.1 hypothetical protein [Leptolyngbya cf. ectocarpi LEGE 11479]